MSSGLSSWPEDAFSCLVHRNVVALCQPVGLPGWLCRPQGRKTAAACALGGKACIGLALRAPPLPSQIDRSASVRRCPPAVTLSQF